ncbi:MAG: mannitol-specific PTS transporter subunit IIC [Acidimicrobiales bacterium]
METTYTPTVEGTGVKAVVQRVGGYLAAMVMPNIGAFIAWGLITALFIPTGWLPNERYAALVGPMITYLLPILIGYTGGRLVHGQRGAVIGAAATMGVIVGSEIPMFLGAMIVGPLAAFILKQFDNAIGHRVKVGFEMLVNNFSLGIIGGGMALLGVWVIGPVINNVSDVLGDGVEVLIDNHLLAFASVLIEPAKVLFLNNAINHGVLGPLGVTEALDQGKSILFMLETNPGPGLGVLLAFMLFGPRRLRPSVPAAGIIHFLGGIHEIYFPYILMKPRMILAAIAGGASGIAVFSLTGVGLVATPSPGSIFAYLAETPRGDHLGVLLGIIVAAAASFAVGSVLLGFGRGEREAAAAPDELAAAQDRSAQQKAESKLAAGVS